MQEKKCLSGLSERIKHVRKELGYTQKQLAGMLGCEQTTVSRFEKGTRQPDARTLYYLLETCQINLNWLLSGKGEIWIKDLTSKRSPIVEMGLDLKNIEEWLNEEEESDPDTRSWFRVQFKKKFPDFAQWLKKRQEAKTELNNSNS